MTGPSTPQTPEAWRDAVAEILESPDHDQCRESGSVAEANCIMEGLFDRGFQSSEARGGAALPPLDVERLAEAIWTASDRHDEMPWIDANEEGRSETLQWAGEIATAYRLAQQESKP